MTSVALIGPVLVGLARTFAVHEAPGDSPAPEQKSKSKRNWSAFAPPNASCPMIKFALPSLLTVTTRVRLVPTTTPPKLNDSGLTEMSGPAFADRHPVS